MREINKLCSELCFEEGGKSQIKIGDMRQIVKIIAIKIFLNPKVLLCLLAYGAKCSKNK